MSQEVLMAIGVVLLVAAILVALARGWVLDRRRVERLSAMMTLADEQLLKLAATITDLDHQVQAVRAERNAAQVKIDTVEAKLSWAQSRLDSARHARRNRKSSVKRASDDDPDDFDEDTP